MKTEQDMNRRLQAVPLGRPPSFTDPVTLPPFTAERKLRDAIDKLQRRLGVSKSEVLRRAVKIGVRTMIAEIKAEAAGGAGRD